MNEVFQIVTTLLGGLALFIFGMNMMSDGLQKAAGDKMRKLLAMLTRNPVMGLVAGAAVTCVIQSSSATTVMVIGFVSAGLMQLPQAISVILGANIGTTITAQLVAFKLGDYAWIILFVGFVMFFFLKKHEKIAQIGQVIFAFGMLFVGINIMGDVMKPLATSPVFTDMIMQVRDLPGLGVLVGAGMTLIIQSSSATIAVLQNVAGTAGPDGIHSILGLQGSIPILFGDNIGTTITAMIAAIGASINAKRTAVAHVIFNVSGTLIFIWFIPYIAKLVRMISPHGIEVDVIARQIANTHLLFNVANALIWLPLIWLMVIIVKKIVPGGDQERSPEVPQYLDEHVLDRPLFALRLANSELTRLAGFAKEMVVESKKAFLSQDKAAIRNVLEKEEIVNKLQDSIVAYLSGILRSDGTTEAQAGRVSHYMHVAADIEHMGDYCTNIVELADEKMKNNYEFSDRAIAEIYECFDHAARMLSDTITVLSTGDQRLAGIVMEEEDEMNKMEERLRHQHMQRLYDNTCSPAFTVIYTDIIHNIEKIGDCCTNIAEAMDDDQSQEELRPRFGDLAKV
ncbi:MAG: Na/Pi cotransporter family protein [Anaerovoracaceae bacterium]|jgi:phosphate:Na+ symporter